MAADNKKYYWLKLKRDFFKRHDIKIIEAMPNGKDYILFYLKLLLESIDHEGNLRFSETIPYNEQMLSVITDTNIDVVRSAMKIFTELHMIDILDDSTIYMSEVKKLTGSETAAAVRMRKSRARSKEIEDKKQGVTMLPNVTKCYTEIELEKEIEKDKEYRDRESNIELNSDEFNHSPPSLISNSDKNKSSKKEKPIKHKYGEYKNVLLTDEEMEKLKNEFPYDYEKRIERLSEYIASHGKKYSSHLATIRSWARSDDDKASKDNRLSKSSFNVKELDNYSYFDMQKEPTTAGECEELQARIDDLKQRL